MCITSTKGRFILDVDRSGNVLSSGIIYTVRKDILFCFSFSFSIANDMLACRTLHITLAP